MLSCLAARADGLTSFSFVQALFLITTQGIPGMKEPHKWSAECKDFLSKCLAKDIGARPDAATLLKVFTPPTAWPYQILALLWLWLALLEALIACACGLPASVLEQGRSPRLPAAGPAQGSEAEGLTLASGPFVHRTPLSPSINTPGPSPTSLITAPLLFLSFPPLRLLANKACLYSTPSSATEKCRAGLCWFATSAFNLSRAFVAEARGRANEKKMDGSPRKGEAAGDATSAEQRASFSPRLAIHDL